MQSITIIALVLVVLGLQGLFYGGFSYYTASRNATAQSLPISAKDRQNAIVPLWAGAGAVATAGLLMLVVGRKRRKTG